MRTRAEVERLMADAIRSQYHASLSHLALSAQAVISTIGLALEAAGLVSPEGTPPERVVTVPIATFNNWLTAFEVRRVTGEWPALELVLAQMRKAIADALSKPCPSDPPAT